METRLTTSLRDPNDLWTSYPRHVSLPPGCPDDLSQEPNQLVFGRVVPRSEPID